MAKEDGSGLGRVRRAIKNLLDRRSGVRENLNGSDGASGDDKVPDFDGDVGKGIHFGIVVGGLTSERDPDPENDVSFEKP